MVASIDCETTGTVAGFHEIIQLAIVPLDHQLKSLDGWCPFYTNIQPNHPERIDKEAFKINGLNLNALMDAPNQDRVIDLFEEWFETLPLPADGKLIPLSHNYIFEHAFLNAWLGKPTFDRYFHYHARDAMQLALAIKDKLALAGLELPFESISLVNLCEIYGIKNNNAHDALADALAEAELYRTLLGAK